jgi:hypothetical protein
MILLTLNIMLTFSCDRRACMGVGYGADGGGWAEIVLPFP